MDEPVELELELASDGPQGYRVDVRSAAGDVTGQLRLDPQAVLGRRGHLQSSVLASAVTSRSAVSEVGAPVRQVGEALFQALFDDRVYAAYKASLALASERQTQLRVVLRVQPSELAALPWEMMYDPDEGAYLCQREPLVRHVSVLHTSRPLTIAPPLRILGVVSAPRDLARLDVEGERQRLEAALTPLGDRVSLRWSDGGQWADVQRELIAEEWHVLHFVGHGGFDHHQQEGVLALENAQGTSDLVGAERFSDLLTLQVEPLRLVLLNSCAGAVSAADDVFSSTAATLIRTGVSAVVAMQFAVSDPAAKAFAAGFYQAVAHNRSVAEAVRIGRIGIRGLGEETLEWVTPVLYLRGDDAALFDVLGSETDPSGPEPEVAAREAAARALYESAMSRFEARDFAEAVADFDLLLRDREDYQDASSRRQEALQALEVSEVYDEARAAEGRGDWASAAEGYTAVLALDPHHPDAPDRLDVCRHRQHVEALRTQLRQHVAAEDWQAAVSVAEELQLESPGDSDPDGLATLARSRLLEEQERRRQEEAERRRRVAEAYDGALAAEERGDWAAAVEGYAGVLALQPHHPSAQERLDQCRHRQRVAFLQEKLREHAAAKDWAAAVTVADELGALSPADGDPDGLASLARSRLDAPPRWRRYALGGAAALVLVAGGAFLFWPDGVPAPFQSAALYDLAGHQFAPGDCEEPESREDAKQLFNEPHTELLVCVRPDGTYNGSLVCTEDTTDFDRVRQIFLDRAEETPVSFTEPPEGRDEPWSEQVTYVDKGFGTARVLWSDEESRCAAVLRTEGGDDVEAAIDYFVTGVG